MAVLIDTSVWVDFFRGVEHPKVQILRESVAGGDAVLGDIILCEILQGIRSDAQLQDVLRRFASFAILDLVGREIAIQSANNYRALRARGITVRKTIDCLIATFCIENGIELLHNDRDFEPFESLGLKVRA